MNLDRLAAEAMQRIRYFIARSAGQHMRAIRASFEAARQSQETQQ